MMATNSPVWARVMNRANEILISSNSIVSFPFQAKKVIKEFNGITIKCYSYQKALEKFQLRVEDFGSESALLTEFHGRKTLFYNTNKPETHVRFSILHEFGHDILNHSLTHNNTEQEHCGVQEVETNFFAAQLLMPEQLIRELQRRGVIISESFLMNTFGVSREAAKKRRATLNKINWDWRSVEERLTDEAICLKYAVFLDSIKQSTFNDLDYFENEYELENERGSWR